jgi:phosphinothricin acetyltransferase
MSIQFKPITKGNISSALNIYNWYVLNSTATFHLETIPQEELERMVSVGHSKYQSFLILFNNEVCGFCYLSQFRYKEAYDQSAEITLYLDQNATGKGLGKATLTYLEEIAKENSISNLVAVITADNSISISMFEKYNYFKVGHLKNIGVKFGKALDVVSYQKEI